MLYFSDVQVKNAMLKILYPYERIESVFLIDYKRLYDAGYRGIIFDIDNTLVPHGSDSTPEVDELFQRIQDIGFQTLLLSNNDEERIKRFLKNISSKYVCDAEKPQKHGYEDALKMLNTDSSNTVCVGDQIFTDILGANRCGIPSILVDYIRKPGETRIGIRRHMENIVLRFYSIRKSCQHRLGNITKEEEVYVVE